MVVARVGAAVAAAVGGWVVEVLETGCMVGARVGARVDGLEIGVTSRFGSVSMLDALEVEPFRCLVVGAAAAAPAGTATAAGVAEAETPVGPAASLPDGAV